jgi:hypothetical protein
LKSGENEDIRPMIVGRMQNPTSNINTNETGDSRESVENA